MDLGYTGGKVSVVRGTMSGTVCVAPVGKAFASPVSVAVKGVLFRMVPASLKAV